MMLKMLSKIWTTPNFVESESDLKCPRAVKTSIETSNGLDVSDIEATVARFRPLGVGIVPDLVTDNLEADHVAVDEDETEEETTVAVHFMTNQPTKSTELLRRRNGASRWIISLPDAAGRI